MNYFVGSAVKIKSEVSVVTGSTVTLRKLLGPDGSEIITDQAMAFDSVDTKNASVTWQSTENTHTAGRYTFFTKVVNGSFSNFAKGQFDLEDQK